MKEKYSWCGTRWVALGSEILVFGRRVRDLTLMAKERRHYPWPIYLLTVLCGLGLVCVAIGIADGWVFIAAGGATIAISLARLHVVLDRQRVSVGVRPLPVDRPAGPRD